MDEDHGPSQIAPEKAPRRTFGDRLQIVKKTFLTREGLIGNYDYAFLFRPNLPFMKKSDKAPPFFGLNDKMPVFLALLLGFQHALAMLAGIITPPIILSGPGGVNLSTAETQYLVSTALIVSGLLSCIQITRFHIYKTPYVPPLFPVCSHTADSPWPDTTSVPASSPWLESPSPSSPLRVAASSRCTQTAFAHRMQAGTHCLARKPMAPLSERLLFAHCSKSCCPSPRPGSF